MIRIFSNRNLFRLHTWVGLISGIFLLLIGLSGSLLVYHHEIERTFNADLYSIDPQATRLSLDEMYKKVFDKHGKEFSSFAITVPMDSSEIVEFMLFGEKENYYSSNIYIVDINPYSGRILREGYCDKISTSFMTWVMFFHENLQLGVIGMTWVTLMSIVIFISLISGIVIYRNKMKEVLLFRIPLKWKNKNRFYRGLHRYIGVWTLIFNMLIFFTGFWMLKGILSTDAWKIEKPEPAYFFSGSIDRCLYQTRIDPSEFEAVYINLPSSSDGRLSISGNFENTSVFLYGYASSFSFDSTNSIVEKFDINHATLPEKLEAAVWPLHIGSYGGNFIKVIYIVVGLSPGLLAITGFLLWLRRQKK